MWRLPNRLPKYPLQSEFDGISAKIVSVFTNTISRNKRPGIWRVMSQDNCAPCSGTGYTTCPRCDGSGQREDNCSRCLGSGKVNCTKCVGTGSVSCKDCAGSGQKYVGIESQGAGGYEACPSCDSGKVPCVCDAGRIACDCNDGKVVVSCGCQSGRVMCAECRGSGKSR